MHQSQIIQHLFQVNSLEDVSRERLETFVEEYPSFGIGHYLLSRKLQKEDAGGFEEKTQLTCLYFSNPFWLQWLLENTDVGGQKIVPEATTPPMMRQWSKVEEAPASTPVIGEPPTGEAPAQTELPVTHPETEEQPPAENVVTMAEEVFYEGPAAAPAMEGETGGDGGLSAAEQLLRSIEQARELRESLLKINTHFGDGGETAGEELAPAVEPVQAAVEPVHAEGEPVAVAAEPVVAAAEPVAITEPVAVVAEPVGAVAEPVVVVAEPVLVDEPARPVHEETPIRDEEVPFVLEETEEPRASVEEIPAVTVHTVQETGVAPGIVFEPLHTIDYFASQGIKFTLEENPADALGKQLKSFTDWLKTMRRLPQKHREVVPDRLAEQAVQDFAAHSIEGKEVLTEAMAEVLAKQGMRQRARAVYEKLSLLNPEKSAYFAAKIEQLNIL